MGVYRDYKSSEQDPKKFLERFSRHIPPPSPQEPKIQDISDKNKYTIPVSRAAMDYSNLKNKCQELLMGIISPDEFRNILDVEKDKLKKFSSGFDNFNFKSKGLSWERELQIKNLFLKAINEYNKGLEELFDYLHSQKKSIVNSALDLINSGGERLNFIKRLSGRETKEIIMEIKDYYETNFDISDVSTNKSSPLPSEESPKEPLNNDFLLKTNIFSGLEPDDLDEIKTLLTISSYVKNDLLYREGEEIDKMYIIISGEAVLYKISSSGQEEIILNVYPGELLGDMGLVDGGPNSTNARVISETIKLCSLSKEDFLSLLQRYPTMSINLNRLYSFRMRDALTRLSNKSYLSIN